MGDRLVPRAEDGLAPRRRLALAAAPAALAAVAAAGCGGSTPYTNVSFRNDLGRPVQLELCRDDACRRIQWRIGIDPGATATEQIRSDGRSELRFLVVGPPEVVYGCRAYRFDRARPDVDVPLSRLRGGCGGGRPVD